MSTKHIEVSGRTEDDAINKALEQLHLDRDEVSVEIVRRAKQGFLGIGTMPAIVKVSYEGADEPAEALETQSPDDHPAIGSEDGIEEDVRTYLAGLLDRIGSEASVVIAEDEGNLRVDLEGADMGQVIGRRGETLDAIQHLTNYSVNRRAEKRVRIIVDAENYRRRREETLVGLAEKMAGKVVKYRKNMSLEPMNAYERHVIHTALQDYDNVSTYSTGSEPNRRIVIAYSRAKPSPQTGESQERA